MEDVLEEEWRTIPEFTNYQISNFGNIYNIKYDMYMRTSVNNFGHVKITLKSHRTGQRYTRSVAQMVAEAFVEPPNLLCDAVVVLDGDFTNVRAENLVWRPTWFSWRYTHQLKWPQPLHYRNLPVINLQTGVEYNSIIEAGMNEGLLFADIWRSTYTGAPIFPYKAVFKVLQRV
ncbi:MAG: NUMOD4 domain-containing protein [Paenisporosarcina sp.]